jgi:hypothetical protein
VSSMALSASISTMMCSLVMSYCTSIGRETVKHVGQKSTKAAAVHTALLCKTTGPPVPQQRAEGACMQARRAQLLQPARYCACFRPYWVTKGVLSIALCGMQLCHWYPVRLAHASMPGQQLRVPHHPPIIILSLVVIQRIWVILLIIRHDLHAIVVQRVCQACGSTAGHGPALAMHPLLEATVGAACCSG